MRVNEKNYIKEQYMDIELKLDGNSLYREESFTDMKVGAVRMLTPVKSDGSMDESRKPIFIGQTQLMSPKGPLPVSCIIKAGTLKEAADNFPEAMTKEVDRMISLARQAQEKEVSRIVVPGR
jgi:hypothetical protein